MTQEFKCLGLTCSVLWALGLTGCGNNQKGSLQTGGAAVPPASTASAGPEMTVTEPAAPANESPETGSPINVAGTWNLKVTEDDGRVIRRTVKLTQDGDELSGVYVRGGQQSPVEEPKLDGDELTFHNTMQQGGQSFRFSYRGTVTGNMIRGTMNFDIAGETGSLPFEGKRE